MHFTLALSRPTWLSVYSQNPMSQKKKNKTPWVTWSSGMSVSVVRTTWTISNSCEKLTLSDENTQQMPTFSHFLVVSGHCAECWRQTASLGLLNIFNCLSVAESGIQRKIYMVAQYIQPMKTKYTWLKLRVKVSTFSLTWGFQRHLYELLGFYWAIFETSRFSEPHLSPLGMGRMLLSTS